MTTTSLDLTNTGMLECEPVNSEGVIPGKCEPKTFDDVLYIPQKGEWYLIADEYAQELKSHAQELDDSIKPLVDKLYTKGAKPNELEAVKQAALQGLNEKGILESYKTLSHLSFLTDAEDKKSYAQALYTVSLLETYLRLLDSASKIPSLDVIQTDYEKNIVQYAATLGVTEADLVEGTVAQQAISSIERFVSVAQSSRIGYADKKELKRFIELRVTPPINKRIEKLEEKAKELAEQNGYSWYKSNQAQQFRFVKSEDTDIEKLYELYQNIIPSFRDIYCSETEGPYSDTMGSLFERFNLEPSRLIPIIASNTFTTFRALNRKGIALPEQLLEKRDLFAKDEETQNKLDSLLQGSKEERVNYFINTCGSELKGHGKQAKTLSSFHYNDENTVAVSLSEIFQGDSVKFIESLGYLNLIALSQVWDQELTAHIQYYVEEIINGEATAAGYADGGLYFLLALRYQLGYLKHKAELALKENKLKFFDLKIPQSALTSVLPLDDVVWSSDDVELTEYRFAWKESDSHVVEFFIMSERNKPRYMHSTHLSKIEELKDQGQLTLLDLSTPIDVQSSDTSSDLNRTKNLKTSLSGAIASAQASAKNSQGTTITLNAEENESFTNDTALIQISAVYGGGDGLSYTVNAQAEFLRFCADSFRFEANYPESFDDFTEKMSDPTVNIASLDVAGQIDLAAGGISVKQMLPSRNGYSMLLPAIVDQDGNTESTYFHLGQLRFDCGTTFYGSVGIGFALAAKLRVRSVESGVSLDPVIPAESSILIPKAGAIKGEVDLFAGARIGHSFDATVKWCKPGAQATAVNFIAVLDENQRNALNTTKRYSVTEDSNWQPLGRFARDADFRFGIGLRGVFQFGYVNRQFVIRCAGGVTFGVGGSLDITVAIYPENLLEIVNALTEILAKEEFRRIEIFTEEDSSGTFNGYKVLNSLITMHLVTGIDISQLALLDMTQTFEQEDKLLMHSHSDTVAKQINKFFEKDEASSSSVPVQPWFKNLLPETRARLLFTLTNEGDKNYLTPELFERIQAVNANDPTNMFSSKAPSLSIDELAQLRKGIAQEAPRWVAIARLLETWCRSEDEMLRKPNVDRQLEETFSRFNTYGKPMLAHEYGNKVMPVVVWERLRGFMNRINQYELEEVNILGVIGYGSDFMNTDSIDVINKVMVRFDKYFDTLPQSRYQASSFIVANKPSRYFVFNGVLKENQSLSTIEKFAYYHLARKEIFPQQYAEESKELKSIFTDPKIYMAGVISDIKQSVLEQAKQEINEWVSEVTGIDDALGQAETQLETIQHAAESGDYQTMFTELGELQ